MNVSGNDVHVRIADGDKRFVEVLPAPDLAGSPEKTAVWRPVDSAFDGV
jgi:hypothetical protein